MLDKPFKTLDELCETLVDSRGLKCDDIDSLKKCLSRTNYYRFSGYAREFQADPRYGDNRFVGDASFSQIEDLMAIDSRMRLLLMEQLSVIEIAVRATLAHEYGRAYGEKAFYLDTDFYTHGPDPEEDKPYEIVKGILSDLERDKSNMVARYVNKEATDKSFEGRIERYSSIPIWVAVEVISFGKIVNLVSYAKDTGPAKAAAATLGVQWAPFAEVVHSLSVLRNLCAHHRQLWNRKMGILCPVQKKLKPKNIKFDPTSAYCQVIMANHYRKKIDGNESVAESIESLLAENELYSQGFRLPNPK